MRRSKAESFETIDFVHGLQQLHERAFFAAGVIRQLPDYSSKFVTAVQIHNLSEQSDFFYTACDEIAHFALNLVDLTAALRATRLRDNAKGAMHVASLHDRDKSGSLLRRELLVANRRFRA